MCHHTRRTRLKIYSAAATWAAAQSRLPAPSKHQAVQPSAPRVLLLAFSTVRGIPRRGLSHALHLGSLAASCSCCHRASCVAASLLQRSMRRSWLPPALGLAIWVVVLLLATILLAADIVGGGCGGGEAPTASSSRSSRYTQAKAGPFEHSSRSPPAQTHPALRPTPDPRLTYLRFGVCTVHQTASALRDRRRTAHL